MLGNVAWVAVRSFVRCASSAKAAGAGWSLATMASPPSSARASRAKAALSRSARKPTAVSAATASITATTSSRSSPARRSRRSWRIAIAAALTGKRPEVLEELMVGDASKHAHGHRRTASRDGTPDPPSRSVTRQRLATLRARRCNLRPRPRCCNGLMSQSSLPSLFLSHGSPMLALEPGPAGGFMQQLGPAVDAAFGRPRAIVVASAHSLTREPALLAAARHDTVHDFGGFPQALYELRYDAPGAPELAPRAAQLVRDAGLPVHVVSDGGLDHGIWIPLRFAYPGVDVPVLPLAFPPNWSPRQLFALGRTLAPLRADGVL